MPKALSLKRRKKKFIDLIKQYLSQYPNSPHLRTYIDNCLGDAQEQKCFTVAEFENIKSTKLPELGELLNKLLNQVI
jgi:hypothetical protein